MADRLVEGLWDCTYCGATQIGGLNKYCPCCGHPQDKDIKFYLGEAKKYLTEEEAQKTGTDPDWLCEYCESLNNARFIYCKNCGAPREADGKNYFTKDVKEEPEAEATQTPPPEPKKKAKKKRNWLQIILSVLAIFLIVGGIAYLAKPKELTGSVSDKSWERTIEVEKYVTVEENDWSVPSGGRTQYTKQEIRSYSQVLDHYETKTRQVAEQVLDGYDTVTSYTDNGNGTFTEHTEQLPRYRTEYRTETYEEPVYVSVPIYDTMYYYEIERWKKDRTEKASGKSDEPQWPQVTLADDKEREGTKTENYEIEVTTDKKGKKYTANVSLSDWEKLMVGDKVTITVSGGEVKNIAK